MGYKLIGHFPFPESAWWDSYYEPLGDHLPALRALHASDPEKLEMLAAIQTETSYIEISVFYGQEANTELKM